MESREPYNVIEVLRAVTVTAASRLHISLADLGLASKRAYGGVGFMVDRPAAVVEVRRSNALSIEGALGLDEVAQRELKELVEAVSVGEKFAARVTVKQHAEQHVGLGSKTALKLSIISALNRLFDLQLTREQQHLLSGRGGTSGIGIHGFFEGGVIWDAGRRKEEVAELLPSSAVSGATALFMLRIPFPDQWQVGLALTPGSVIYGSDEVDFVRSRTPIHKIAALQTMADLYHGVLPAFQCADLPALAQALADIASYGFKREEVERCGEVAASTLRALQARGYAAGISSVGPMLYVITRKADPISGAEVERICQHLGSRWLGFYNGRNRAADLVLESSA